MSELFRKQIPQVVLIFGVFWIFFEFFLNIPSGPQITNELGRWVTAVANFALLLGALNIIRINGRKVMQRTEGEWYHGVIILASLLVTFACGIFYRPWFTTIYDYIYYGLNVAWMCFVGFYLYSAMYRIFRVRNLDSAAAIIACIFVMATNAPISGAISPIIPQIGQWIADVPGMGAWRGIMMSAVLGMYAMAMRAVLGLEKAYIGVSEEE